MTSKDQRMRGLIEEQAAEWMVENRHGLDMEQRRAFTAWLKASPVHVEEYLALAALSQVLSAACEPVDLSHEQLLARARREADSTVQSIWPGATVDGRAVHPRGWQPLAVAASLSVLSVGLLTLGYFWLASRPSISSESAALHFQTRHGEQQTVRLADQSVVHLNTDTAVSIRIGKKERLVLLEAGEADFEVIHESARPFRVSAGSAQVVDVGTKFDVQIGPASTLVAVAEGRVNVMLRSKFGHTTPYVQLSAGQQIRIAEGSWPSQPVAADVEGMTAWLHQQIKFENEPLARVTNEFNRYSPTPFEIETPVLGDLKISGVFAIDDTDAFIAFLSSLKGVHVQVTATRILVSQE